MPFLARFQSGCNRCDDPIEEGQVARMTYDGAVHESCWTQDDPARRAACSRCHLVHGLAQEDCDG
jgi:hypothetical protein